MQLPMLPKDSEFSPNANRPWLQRTFAPLSPGGIRGNILLLSITTMGSSFFYLPYFAKQIGIIATLITLVFTATVSYFSSTILYQGFKHTGAKTYDECFEKLLGKGLGLFSNIVIFLHVFTAVLATWIFSYKFTVSALITLLSIDPGSSSEILLRYIFFGITFITIFLMTLTRSIEKLKTVAMIGIFFILYLVVCFVGLTPDYFKYYDSQGRIEIHEVIWTPYMLKVYGVCQALFLNQYTILPICHNVIYTNQKRITKIIHRSLYLLMSIYIVLMACGYFSEPNDTQTEIFLLREPLPGSLDRFVVFGKLGFGLALFIAILVKSCYLLLYVDQLILKFKDAELESETPVIEEASSQDTDSYKFPPDNFNVVREEKAPVQITAQVSQTSPRIPLIIYVKNFCFFAVILFLVIYFMDKLSKLISLLGGFIGAFEIIILPGKLNRHNPLENESRVLLHDELTDLGCHFGHGRPFADILRLCRLQHRTLTQSVK
jgi:amino acid permease